MNENLITEQELRDYAPDLDLSAYATTTISGLIARASKLVADAAHVDGFFKVAVTNEEGAAMIGSHGDLVLSVRRRPLVVGDVSALSLNGQGVVTNLNLSDSGNYNYFLQNPGNFLVYPSNFLIGSGAGLLMSRNAGLFYKISYVGGYATDIANIPVDLKEAATLMVRHLLARKNNPAGVKSFSQGSLSVTYGLKSGEDEFTAEVMTILNGGGYVRRVP